jgi:hypothetical protein
MNPRVRERREEDPMAMKTVRFRVHGGRLEPLEPLALVEGAELDVNVPVPDAVSAKSPPALRTRYLGVREPLTREEIYEDVG